jgi:septum site-determining protein MinC
LTQPLLAESAAKIFGRRDFFGGKPCLFDVGAISADTQDAALPGLDWKALLACFADYGLRVVGLRGGTPALTQSAEAAGLASFSTDHPPPKIPLETAAHEEPLPSSALPARLPIEKAAETGNSAAAPAPTMARGIMFLEQPLRSGQVIYARDSDLVVTAFVNPGAEIIADGNIYCYAPLLGRAHAGARGDTGARIFSTRFAAEVVAIAGLPLALADGIPAEWTDTPLQIRRQGDNIRLEPCGSSTYP